MTTATEAPPPTLPPDLEGTGTSIGSVAYDFNLRNQWSERTQLYGYYGTVVTVDWGAMWAAACEPQLQMEQEIYEDLQEQGFQAISVMIQNKNGSSPTTNDLAAYSKELGLTYPVLADEDTQTYYQWQVPQLGTVYVLDREMVIRDILEFPSEEEFRAAVEPLL